MVQLISSKKSFITSQLLEKSQLLYENTGVKEVPKWAVFGIENVTCYVALSCVV